MLLSSPYYVMLLNLPTYDIYVVQLCTVALCEHPYPGFEILFYDGSKHEKEIVSTKKIIV